MAFNGTSLLGLHHEEKTINSCQILKTTPTPSPNLNDDYLKQKP